MVEVWKVQPAQPRLAGFSVVHIATVEVLVPGVRVAPALAEHETDKRCSVSLQLPLVCLISLLLLRALFFFYYRLSAPLAGSPEHSGLSLSLSFYHFLLFFILDLFSSSASSPPFPPLAASHSLPLLLPLQGSAELESSAGARPQTPAHWFEFLS